MFKIKTERKGNSIARFPDVTSADHNLKATHTLLSTKIHSQVDLEKQTREFFTNMMLFKLFIDVLAFISHDKNH